MTERLGNDLKERVSRLIADKKEDLEEIDQYNSSANKPLPYAWYELCKLRDLINPLQMLGEKENHQMKYLDLRCIISDTLVLFGY